MSLHCSHLPRLAPLLGASVALTLLAAGCTSGEATASKSDGAPSTIKVQVPPVTDVAPIYLAKKNGLFERQGLNVEVTVGQGGSAIAAALQSGGTDIGFVNYVSAFSGIAHQLPISLVNEGTLGTPKNFGLVVPNNSDIMSTADLKGKTIGVISTGSVSDLTTNVQLTAAGLTPSDVKYVNVPLPNLLSAVGTQVDAVSLAEPTLTKALTQGNRLVLDAYTGPIAGMPIAGYFSTSEFAAGHADLLQRFADVIATQSQTANGDQASVRAILPTYTAIDATQATAITLPQFAPKTDAARVQNVADLMVKYGLLQTPVNVTDHLALNNK